MNILDPKGRPFRKAAEFATNYGRRGKATGSVLGTSEERPLNRAERRAIRNDIRAYRKAAARQRDRDYGSRGLESPAQPISDAIRKRGLGHRWLRGDRWLAKLPTRGQRRRRAATNRKARQEALRP